MRTGISIVMVALAASLLVLGGRFLSDWAIHFHADPFINKLVNFQLFGILLALVVLTITLVFTPSSVTYLSIGKLSAIADKSKWLAINGESSWLKNGLQFLIFITLGTAIFMYLGLKYTNTSNNFSWSFMPFVLLFSLSNSLFEEIIFRFAVIGNLDGRVAKDMILIISAVLFGLPHFYGNPGGITGVIMSAALGFILAKATYETHGLGIAWVIHFVQDIVIFTAIFMMNAK